MKYELNNEEIEIINNNENIYIHCYDIFIFFNFNDIDKLEEYILINNFYFYGELLNFKNISYFKKLIKKYDNDILVIDSVMSNNNKFEGYIIDIRLKNEDTLYFNLIKEKLKIYYKCQELNSSFIYYCLKNSNIETYLTITLKNPKFNLVDDRKFNEIYITNNYNNNKIIFNNQTIKFNYDNFYKAISKF